MENQTVQPKQNPEESQILPGHAAPAPSLALLRPLPAALGIVGLALVLVFLFDLGALLPPRFQDTLWQIGFLERLFNEASIPLLGILAMLAGAWLGDAIDGEKSRLKTGAIGALALVMGVSILLAIPLYSNNVNRVYKLKHAELLDARKAQAPDPGSDLAIRFDKAEAELSSSLFANAFRFNANAGTMGIALLLLSVFGIRQTRKRADVGFTCPTCKSANVRLSQMNPTEKSLALVTRLHTFRCQDCGWRFRKFSLTGKPFTFFF